MAEWKGTIGNLIKVAASDILNAIAEGQNVNIEHAIIEGDLNIEKIADKLKRDESGRFIIRGDVVVGASEISGDVSFNKASFNRVTVFAWNTFKGGISFSNAIFSRGAFFHDSKFKSSVSFVDAFFSGYTSFDNSHFSGNGIGFQRVQSQPPITFNNIKYWSDCVRIYLARFFTAARLREVTKDATWWDRFIIWALRLSKNSPKGIPRKPTRFYIDSQNIDGMFNPHFKRYVADQLYTESLKQSHRFIYWLWQISSNCGRSLSLWAFWSLIISLIFGLLYADIPCPSFLSDTFIGDFLDWADPEIYIDEHTANNWFTGFYFSIVTFTTLGFGDVKPADGAGQFWITLEVVVGYIMLGILIGIGLNKIARRS
ncbi:hypothetical protein H8E77_43565 [bacterium]|nr:hypothetical protein [bacterium]